ncbi:MAG: amidohydrolase [Acidaminococcus sp.]|jgi:aminobenzoyl-glutamate utilization protein A|nr:amidohydrolase [Acidaminococcus sp.]
MTLLDEALSMKDEMIARRRDLHAHPELAWTEFRTASIVATELKKLGYEVLIGRECMKPEARMGVPSEEEIEKCKERALSEGADPALVAKMEGGFTGVVGIMHFKKPGKTVGLRFDMDCLLVDENPTDAHRPTKEGFASQHEGLMHACGHDGHTTIGLGVARLIAAHKDEMAGTVKLCFQPGEEGVMGARCMAESGVVDDVDYFLSGHIGLGSGTNSTFVCMTQGFLATTKIDAKFTGLPAHAGANPEKGRNALLAAAQASIAMHTISRHSGGPSRINVGVLHAGTGRNVIPDNALIKFETRGATTAINEYMSTEAKRMVRAAADMYGVEVEMKEMGSAASGNSSPDMGEEIYNFVSKLGYYDHVQKSQSVGGSEDCSYFMSRVQDHGGKAVYMLYGTEEASGHHTSEFDFNEDVLPVSAATVTELVKYFGNKQ